MTEQFTEQLDLVLTSATPLTLQPAAVYLSSLTSGSRRTMGKALNAIARMLTNDQCDALTLDWAALSTEFRKSVAN